MTITMGNHDIQNMITFFPHDICTFYGGKMIFPPSSHGFSHGFSHSPGVALWEASFVLAEWLSRHGDTLGLAASRAFQAWEIPMFCGKMLEEMVEKMQRKCGILILKILFIYLEILFFFVCV